ncbi:MAG: hypothetical protein CMM84_13345 [Rhodothermaceae bacterium]|nr:hypothetical protein [Rhodothermaceae bacterium]MBC11350.1 hypothetical protein [Rhodothermaceae bacterium]
MHGDGSVAEESPGWTLTVPDARRALGGPPASDGPPPPSQGAERAGRRILRAVGLAGVLACVAALTVPITRTVDLDGRLVPERVLPIRAAEPGLLTDILVAAGDTVRPGQLVARLRSPDLDEAVRTSIGHDPGLLARRARLDVVAPPWTERQSDGAADPATFWRGGVVLTEDLPQRRGARLDAGDTVLDLAALDADGRVPHIVRAWAPEREALRARPGMTARLTFPAIPQERPRQASGVVRRVALAPEVDGQQGVAGEPHAARWRVELSIDPDEIAVIVGEAETPIELRAGFSVEVAVLERRETLAQTAIRWARTHVGHSLGAP